MFTICGSLSQIHGWLNPRMQKPWTQRVECTNTHEVFGQAVALFLIRNKLEFLKLPHLLASSNLENGFPPLEMVVW